jgi:assimilatory nitrate reductase catalytic subunit
VRTDIEILCAMGLAMNLGPTKAFTFGSAREVFEEFRLATAGGPADYSGITYDRIDEEGGVFWPCPSMSHPGTPRLFEKRFATPSGSARFHAVKHIGPAEPPDRDYPLHLTTGRVLAHYQTGTQTRRVDTLNAIVSEPTAEMNPVLAREHCVTEGDLVPLATRRGVATFRVRLTPGIRPDTVFVPFHWPGANTLTNPALDPISRMPEFKVCAARIDSSPKGVAP